MRLSTFVAAIALTTLSACMLKTGGADADRLLQPRGAMVSFTQAGASQRGELLGFRGDTAFIYAANQIYAAHHRQVIERAGEVSTFSTEATSLRELQRRVRYPRGITPELEAALLTRIGQAASVR
jgi:hypothetical protein